MYTYIPISPPSCVSLPPSLSQPYRWTQNTELTSLCSAAASHQLLFYIWQCIYVHATLSLRPSLPFPLPMSSSPFSMSSSLFLSYPQVPHNLFFFSQIPYVCVSIWYLFFSFCLTSLRMTVSRSIHHTTYNSISFLFMAE